MYVLLNNASLVLACFAIYVAYNVSSVYLMISGCLITMPSIIIN